jgi:hypothetical protein
MVQVKELIPLNRKKYSRLLEKAAFNSDDMTFMLSFALNVFTIYVGGGRSSLWRKLKLCQAKSILTSQNGVGKMTTCMHEFDIIFDSSYLGVSSLFKTNQTYIYRYHEFKPLSVFPPTPISRALVFADFAKDVLQDYVEIVRPLCEAKSKTTSDSLFLTVNGLPLEKTGVISRLWEDTYNMKMTLTIMRYWIGAILVFFMIQFSV